MVLQSSLWKGPAFYKAGKRMQMFPKPSDAQVAVLRMVSVYFSPVFPCHVWKYGVPDLSGCGRSPVAERSDSTVLDVPGSLGLDVYGGNCSGLGGSIQFRILQYDADFTADRSGGYGTF